jgi:predicted DNA-binding transcriptional regulator YafY
MPEKITSYRSYGEKLISLFAKLLFSREKHSLIELSGMLGCSKQTVMRLVEDIRMSYGVDIEESFEDRKKYYQIKRRIGKIPSLSLTETEINVLHMCLAFTEHLLGPELFNEATHGMEKNQAMLSHERNVSQGHFTSYHTGRIDYSPHQKTMRQLIKAMEEKKVCQVTYQNIMVKRAKTFYIKPLKIFSYRDTLYLHAKKALAPDKHYSVPEFDPLLAIHRIKELEIIKRPFEFPKDYDFEKVFNREFGIIKDDSFEVEVEFKKYAARYVAERNWSPEQRIIQKNNGKIEMIFRASSKVELIAWILSFGNEARVIKPDWLVKKVKQRIKGMQESYKYKSMV